MGKLSNNRLAMNIRALFTMGGVRVKFTVAVVILTAPTSAWMMTSACIVGEEPITLYILAKFAFCCCLVNKKLV